MKKYIIYGAGHDGIVTLNYLKKENVAYFCDSTMYGNTIEGIPVVPPEGLESEAGGRIVVLAVSKPQFIIEISRNLYSMGIDFVYWKDAVTEKIRDEANYYSKINNSGFFQYDPFKEYIIISDRFKKAGTIRSYFWQDLWAAQKIFQKAPRRHFDIGSRVDGFISHLLSFGQLVTQIDIRPLDCQIPGFDFVQADATDLNGIDDESISSLSALCSLEHFGLGRYGDSIDPDACFKCFKAIQRVIKKHGDVYISVPIGKEHLEFNAHRVFRADTIVKSFDKMELKEFSSCFRDEIEKNIDLHAYDEWDEYGGERFGLFHFVK